MKKKQYICPQTECIKTNMQGACLLTASEIPIDNDNPTNATEPEEVKGQFLPSSNDVWETEW